MGWTAAITEKKSVNGDARISVTYSSGERQFVETHAAASPEQFKQTVLNRVKQLDQADEVMASVEVGIVSAAVAKDADSEVPVVDTPKADFQAALRNVEQYRKAIDLGLIIEADRGYQAAMERLRGLFSLDYLELL